MIRFTVQAGPLGDSWLLVINVPYGTSLWARLWGFLRFSLKDWNSIMAQSQKRYF